DGTFYGSTRTGGPNGAGTIYKVTTNGTFSILIQNTNISINLQMPVGELIQASDGALYGTTQLGGTLMKGTVFKVGTNGLGYAVLYNFGIVVNDGQTPLAGLVQGSDGGLYGTTSAGGSNSAGAVFRLSTNGTGYAVIHHFGGANDGQ